MKHNIKMKFILTYIIIPISHQLDYDFFFDGYQLDNEFILHALAKVKKENENFSEAKSFAA